MITYSIYTQSPCGGLVGRSTLNGEIEVYKGIPYALPPVGERRWRRAEPAISWKGYRAAFEYGPSCPQFPMPEGPIFHHPLLQSSEDCLYLNIWTPTDKSEPLPVMVWIHGGGLFAGSGRYPEYDGAKLSRHGAVVVTLNYRLGMLGYFAHPDLSEEDHDGASGNYGLSDMVEALRWVKENIESFGGDPENVTVFGESAGGWAVSQLVASPLTTGLIHRAIVQSGVGNFPMLNLKEARFGRPSAEADGVGLVESLGASSIAELRSWPAQTLIDEWLALGRTTQAIVDGWSLPDEVFSIFESGRQNDIPILVGFNENEANNLAEVGAVPLPPNSEAYILIAKRRYGEHADEFLSLYPPDNMRDSIFRAYRDRSHAWGAVSLAQSMSSVSSSAFLYLFRHQPSSFVDGMGAYHMSEIPYVFNNLEDNASFCHPILRHREVSEEATVLADAMSACWVSFAKKGRPSWTGSLDWPAYEGSGKYVAITTDGPIIESDLLDGACEFHDRLNMMRRMSGAFWTPLFDPSDVDGYSF